MGVLTGEPTIAIAPGSYKGTVLSHIAAGPMEAGVRSVFPKARVCVMPLADGGEGTLEIIRQHRGGIVEVSTVSNALGNPVSAKWLRVDGEVFLQTSEAIGLSMLRPEERNPLRATSFGVGELIQRALDYCPRAILICMGDSATMDAGMGMLAALGVRFLNKRRDPLEPTVSSIPHVTQINTDYLDPRVRKTEIIGLADTSNSLCGDVGHVRVYGVQKGLQLRDVQMLTEVFDHFGRLVEAQFGVAVRDPPYTSASGGIAAAIKGVLGGRLVHTLDYLDSLCSFKQTLAQSHIVITGEGRFDGSSKYGKVPYVVTASTRSPCLLIVGGYTKEGRDDLRRFNHAFLFCLPGPQVDQLSEVGACAMIFDTVVFALKALAAGAEMALVDARASPSRNIS